MELSRVERRRRRRIQLRAPLLVRRGQASHAEVFEQEVAQDLSLAGVYFETDQHAYEVNDVVVTSVSIPGEQQRTFPFTRLAGRSRVVRVQSLPEVAAKNHKRYGVALEFGDDFTVLTALPS